MLKRRGSFFSLGRPNKRTRIPIGSLGAIGSVGSALASMYYASRNGSQASTRGGSNGIGVTNQYDRQRVYRKRYRPRRKKRMWKKFVRKVGAVTERDYGTNTILRNSQLTVQANPGLQGVASVTLYGKDGVDGVGSVGNGDLRDIYNNDLNSLPTTRYKFCSAVLDMTVVNNSVTEVQTDNLGLEVDVYELMFRVVATAADPLTMFATNQAQQINAGNPPLTLTTRGCTPFDLPDVLARMGISILKKTKYFIGKGQQFTYQLRDPKSYQWQKNFIDDGNNDFMVRKTTKTLLIVFKSLPGTQDVTPIINVGVTRKFMYKEMDVSNDADNLLP